MVGCALTTDTPSYQAHIAKIAGVDDT